METRNIKVTIEEAYKWFNSTDKTLKTLALSAYTEKELMFYRLKSNAETIHLDVPKNEVNKIKILSQLSLIASFYNNIIKAENNTRYFIGKNEEVNHSLASTLFDNIYIYKHINVTYAGIVYFNSEAVLRKIVSLLGKDKIKQLFNN